MEIKENQKLICPLFEKGCFVQVLHVGKSTFFGMDNKGVLGTYTSNRNWQPYEEEVVKDLEGVFKYYEVYKQSDRICVKALLGNHSAFDHSKGFDSDKFETITEKEAIERGLNV